MLASPKIAQDVPTELRHLIEGYKLCARTEGKSQNTIDIVTNSVNYLHDFLCSNRLPTDVRYIGSREIRVFTLYLQEKRCFSNHRFSRPQNRGLSGYSINCYLRSIRAFWSWLIAEEIIDINPFNKVKIPQPPQKVIPTFAESQILRLLSVINVQTPEGYRNYAIILTLIDTALRVSELSGVRMDDIWLDQGLREGICNRDKRQSKAQLFIGGSSGCDNR